MKNLIDYTFYTNESELTFDIFGSLCKIGLKLRGLRPEHQGLRSKLRDTAKISGTAAKTSMCTGKNWSCTTKMGLA
jgi:hypothetical protein